MKDPDAVFAFFVNSGFTFVGDCAILFSVSRQKGNIRTVAQPGSAFAWGAKGHEFKSRRSDQFTFIETFIR